MDDISRLKILSRTIQWDFLEAGELCMDINNAMASMIALTNGDALRVEVNEECMEGREARSIG